MSSLSKPKGKLLTISGIKSNEIGYNPAVIPQRNKAKITDGQAIIAVRVEDVNSHWLNPQNYNPHIMFFSRQRDSLMPIPDTPIFNQFEDPFATWINLGKKEPQLLFGAVKVDSSSKPPIITTCLFLAPSVMDLNPTSPITTVRMMKDVRVTQMADGKLAVFTRPTENEAFPGRIGFITINSLDELEQAIPRAPLLNFNLPAQTKIGPNEAHAQMIKNPNGQVRESLHVYCHLATADISQQRKRPVFDGRQVAIHYAGYEFDLDPEQPFAGPIKLRKTADRQDFPKNTGLNKGASFADVIFPGGTGGPEFTQFYTGVEDACVGVLQLET